MSMSSYEWVRVQFWVEEERRSRGMSGGKNEVSEQLYRGVHVSTWEGFQKHPRDDTLIQVIIIQGAEGVCELLWEKFII